LNELSLVDCEPRLSSARYAWLASRLEPARDIVVN
jgi:hypothetical protein